MPAAVQTRSRANRAKLFKKFYRHSTPSFRCYHGSRLPPRSSFEGMFKHSKFLSSGIKWGKPIKEKGKVSKLLSKKLKAEPKKRKKRGILKRKETGKKKVVVKKLKKKKTVSFGKKKSYYKRQAQEAKEYAEVAGRAQLAYGRDPRTFGAKGDPKTTFKIDAQGRLVQVARQPGKIRIV